MPFAVCRDGISLCMFPSGEGKVYLWMFRCSNTAVLLTIGDRGGTVVKVLCYKSEGRWFDSRWCHWNFSLT